MEICNMVWNGSRARYANGADVQFWDPTLPPSISSFPPHVMKHNANPAAKATGPKSDARDTMMSGLNWKESSTTTMSKTLRRARGNPRSKVFAIINDKKSSLTRRIRRWQENLKIALAPRKKYVLQAPIHFQAVSKAGRYWCFLLLKEILCYRQDHDWGQCWE